MSMCMIYLKEEGFEGDLSDSLINFKKFIAINSQSLCKHRFTYGLFLSNSFRLIRLNFNLISSIIYLIISYLGKAESNKIIKIGNHSRNFTEQSINIDYTNLSMLYRAIDIIIVNILKLLHNYVCGDAL